MLRALCARAPCAPSSRRAAPSGAPRGAAAAPLRSATASPPAVAAPPAPVFGDDLADGDFRSAEVAARVAGAGDKLWAPGGFEFSHLRAWLEASLPQVTQTEQGYFNAALAAVDHSGSDGSAKLAKDTQEYASCLWTRDVSNVALALAVAGDRPRAVRALTALGKLYARPDHAACMDKMIAARGEGYSNFTCAPIRFHMVSGDRTDPWAHMQLDALGLFLVAYCTLGAAGVLAADLGVVTRFVSYLGAIEYQTRPDLGHWEEQPPEVLTSSLGCCVAGLRAAEALLRRSGDAAGADAAAALSAAGAAALEPRLGGATGGGAWESLKRREDGALTTLLLPQVADLLHLSAGQRQSVAAAVLRLRRPYGVLRYADDSYYGADYQERLRAWKETEGNGGGDAYPSREERDSWVVPGCEAEWTLFEPMLLLHFLHAHRAEPSALTAQAARRSLARVLAAVEQEGGGGGGGDGGPVLLHVHESYCVVKGKLVPNDIQDLLWAVAYVRMAIAAVGDALADDSVAPFV